METEKGKIFYDLPKDEECVIFVTDKRSVEVRR